MSESLKTIISYSSLLVLLSLIIAGVSPSPLTLGIAAFLTMAIVAVLAWAVLKDQ